MNSRQILSMNLLISRSDVVERRAGSSIEYRRPLRVALCAILFATASLQTSIVAQGIPGNPTQSTAGISVSDSKAQALHRQQALAAIRQGSLISATNLLRQNVDTRIGAPPADAQLGAELAHLAFRLQENKEVGLAQQVAGSAISTLERGRALGSGPQVAATHMIAAQLCEGVYQDRARALAMYESALSLDPTIRRASERIVHLRAIEEAARNKAAANELLRQRAAQAKR